jgi:hypothetical protein
VFAVASVGITRRGSLTLTFYRLSDSREPLAVRRVRLSNTTTMTEGREIQFNEDGVSIPVHGRFDYSVYFPAIPIQVEFSSGEHTWSRDMDLRFSYVDNYIDGIGIEPKPPRSVAEFLALRQSPEAGRSNGPTTERP